VHYGAYVSKVCSFTRTFAKCFIPQKMEVKTIYIDDSLTLGDDEHIFRKSSQEWLRVSHPGAVISHIYLINRAGCSKLVKFI